jgi:hypothetical protein
MERTQSPSTSAEWKLPPEIKVLEALGAIGDGRIKVEDNTATVISSDGSKTYTVRYDEEKHLIGSTDNGSVFKGYYGYPIVAFLMLKGLLPLRRDLAEALKGIPWREWNERYKRYWIVEKIVLDRLKERGFDGKEVKKYIKEVLARLKELRLGRMNLGQRTLF